MDKEDTEIDSDQGTIKPKNCKSKKTIRRRRNKIIMIIICMIISVILIIFIVNCIIQFVSSIIHIINVVQSDDVLKKEWMKALTIFSIVVGLSICLAGIFNKN